jgi:aminoglycoside phosphotransferase
MAQIESIGDKMLDIAILSWTIRGNFGKKYEVLFLKRLNVDPEDKMLEYYRLIYNLNLPDYKNWGWVKE